MTRGPLRHLRVWRLVWLVLALSLCVGALLLPDPTLFPIRNEIGAGLIVIGILGAGLALRRTRSTSLIFASAALFAAWQLSGPWLARSAVLAHSQADAAILRHFIVGYRDDAMIREFVRDARVGGIFLTQRNVEGRSAAAVAAEIAALQAIRHEAGLPPLIVTADQEGGPVSHLSPPLPHPAALSTLAGLPAADRAAAARRLGEEQGAALKSIGVTMDLAPVVDLKPDHDPGAFDLHTRIATRAISSDPSIVAAIAERFADGLLAAGVTPTAKHFPGLGRVETDTHLFSASLDTSEGDLEGKDWVPFKALATVPGAAVMLSHTALNAIDPGVPASRSKRLVDGILRDRWGFRGIAITDDLSMGAVEHAGLCRAVEGALNAGIDLLLVSWDTDKVYPAIRCALDAEHAGRLDRTMLAVSAHRLDAFAGR